MIGEKMEQRSFLQCQSYMGTWQGGGGEEGHPPPKKPKTPHCDYMAKKQRCLCVSKEKKL